MEFVDQAQEVNKLLVKCITMWYMDLQEETCIAAAQTNELKIKAIAVGILVNSLEKSSEVLFQGPRMYRTF